jgi:hypothetical protein
VHGLAKRRTISYWPAASGVPANTYPRSIVEAPATSQWLLSPGVLSANTLLGTSSWLGKHGRLHADVRRCPTWLASGSGVVISGGRGDQRGRGDLRRGRHQRRRGDLRRCGDQRRAW